MERIKQSVVIKTQRFLGTSSIKGSIRKSTLYALYRFKQHTNVTVFCKAGFNADMKIQVQNEVNKEINLNPISVRDILHATHFFKKRNMF